MDPQATPTPASPVQPADDRSDLLKSMDQNAEQAQQASTGSSAPVYGGPHVIQPDKKMGIGETIANVIDQDWIVNSLIRAHQAAGFQPDGSEMPKLDTPEFKALTQGIPEEQWDRLYAADSEAQRQWIAERLRNENATEQRLNDSGAFGIAGRFATDALDPVGLALGVATGGIGVAGKAARLAKTAAKLEKVGKIADASAALERASALTKATSAGKIALQRGTIDAGVNAVLAEANVQGTPSRDQWDVVQAAGLGLFMGAGISRVFAGSELTAIRRSLEDTRAKVSMAELSDYIDQRKQDIVAAAENSPTAANLKNAQDDLNALQTEIQRKAEAARPDHGKEVDAEIEAAHKHLDDLEADSFEKWRAAQGDLDPAAADEVSNLFDRLGVKGADAGEEPTHASDTPQHVREILDDAKDAADEQEVHDAIEANRARNLSALDGPEGSAERISRVAHATADRHAAMDLLDKLRAEDGGAGYTPARGTAAVRLIVNLERDATEFRRYLKIKFKNHDIPRDHPIYKAAGDAQFAADSLRSALKDAREGADESARSGLHEKLGAAQQAVADAQKAHDAAMAAHEADLAKLTQIQEAGVQGLKSADPAEAAQNASAFGPDSGGAARYMGAYESVNPDHEYPSGLPMSQQAMSKFGRAVGTITSILRGNKDATVRAELGPLVGDTIGTIDGSTSSFGASEIAKRLSKSYWTKFNKAVTESYDKWAEANGHSVRQKWTRPVRDQFMSDVGLHIRGQASQDEHVARAAETIRGLFEQFRKEAKEAGVKGFEDLEHNPNYLPRVFDFHALERIEKQIGTANVKRLFENAIKKNLPEIEDSIAARMAHFYVKRMKELRVGSDVGLLNGMRFDDIGFLRKFLSEAGASQHEAEDIVEKFAALKKSQHRDGGGDFRNAKHRTSFDENFGMDFRDEQAFREKGVENTVHVKVSDLLENNVEALFGRYQRSMAGHIGLAKVGIMDHADFAARLSRVEGALEGDTTELGKVKDVANLVYKLVTGQPIEDANLATKWGRLIRDWNYATTMNQAGFSQTPDWAAMLSLGYFRYTVRMIPEMRTVLKRLRNGDIADDEANMIQDWLGVGTDNYNNSVFSAYDDPNQVDGFAGMVGKVEHGLRVAGRVTTKISGLGWMNDVGTRMAAKAVLWRLTDEVRKGGVISSKRLAQIGLDQKMLARIKTQINGTTEHVDADFVGKQRILNFAKWTDIEARDAMLNGIFREARRMFQEEDLGETSAWMHHTLGKLILQFRRFMMVSYTKQMLYAANMRDAEAATQVLVGTALAGLSYTTQFGIKAASISDPDEREKFKEKYLTPKAISLAAWSRGNHSAFFPAALDSLTGTFLGIKNFDNRASQLGSGLFDGNPTVSTLNSMGQAVGSLVQPLVRGDKQFTRSDAAAWRHLMPFQNFIGMDIPLNAMTKNLPKRSTDPNPNEVDWALPLH